MCRNVLDYLYAAFRKNPDKTAFSDGEAGLTFGELYRLSRSVGTALIRRGLRKRPVAVLMRRSPAEIAAFLGIAAAGSFYVPLDEELPRERLRLIFDHLRPAALICDSVASAEGLEEFCGGVVLPFEEAAATVPDGDALREVCRQGTDSDPLYIIFTSGSSGAPKGVVVSHRSVIDYTERLSEVMGFSENTVFGCQSPLYYDACLKELYPTLKFGALTYLIPRRLFATPAALVEFLNAHRVNTVCWTASALTAVSSLGTFDCIKPEHLTAVAFGGEVLPPRQLALWRRAAPEAEFTNLYGPTECTGMTAFFRVPRDFPENEPIPIGRPLPNREMLLVTDDHRPARPGEVGEIYIRGAGVALGYFNDPERTAAAFVQNPLHSLYPDRVYKTGDLARYNGDGELVYISRRDRQIKHMGRRIEPGDIEACACEAPGVNEAAVIYDRMRQMIVLFYIGGAETAELAAFMRAKLPRYMVPARLIRLEAMPLSATGKTDIKALTEMYERGCEDGRADTAP